MNLSSERRHTAPEGQKPSSSIAILFEDDCCVVFNKPAGLLVIPTPQNEKNTLVNIVNQYYNPQKDQYHLHPCHRLDRETSGVIIFAKGKNNQKLMMEAFRRKAVLKHYLAFVQGRLPKATGEIRGVIKDFDQRKHHNRASQQVAVTRYRVIESRKSFSIIDVEPLTGKTNQIRIHFSQYGNPLIGDRKYSIVKNFHLKFKRTALHARSIEWTHPINHKKITVTAELPKDMEVFLARHRN